MWTAKERTGHKTSSIFERDAEQFKRWTQDLEVWSSIPTVLVNCEKHWVILESTLALATQR